MALQNSFKNLTLCLGIITLVCGALLAGVYVLTEKPIEAAAAAKTQNAIAAVSVPFETLGEAVTASGEAYYIAIGEQGDTLGYVVNAFSDGFGGKLSLMVGFRADGSIYDTAVLSHSETPGLGAKCTDPAFAGQFKGFDPAVKSLSVKKDGGDVDAITASTITSRAYCAALRRAVEIFAGIAPVKAAADTVENITVEETTNE